MLEKKSKNKTLAIFRLDIVILASLLVVAGLFFAGRSQAVEFNPSIKGVAPLLLNYNSEKKIHDVLFGMDASYGDAVIKKKAPAYYDHQMANDASGILAADDQKVVINLFEIKLEPEKRKRSGVYFGMSALSQDFSGADDPFNHSLSAKFDNSASLSNGKPPGIFDRIKETLLMIHFTIKY